MMDTGEAPEAALIDEWDALTAEGMDILDRERAAFVSGDYAEVVALTEAKLALLSRLDKALPTVPRNIRTLRRLERLVDASKRNEEIIAAARQGLSYAKLKIREIDSTRRGVVAYAQDGSRIESRADQIGEGTSL